MLEDGFAVGVPRVDTQRFARATACGVAVESQPDCSRERQRAVRFEELDIPRTLPGAALLEHVVKRTRHVDTAVIAEHVSRIRRHRDDRHAVAVLARRMLHIGGRLHAARPYPGGENTRPQHIDTERLGRRRLPAFVERRPRIAVQIGRDVRIRGGCGRGVEGERTTVDWGTGRRLGSVQRVTDRPAGHISWQTDRHADICIGVNAGRQAEDRRLRCEGRRARGGVGQTERRTVIKEERVEIRPRAPPQRAPRPDDLCGEFIDRGGGVRRSQDDRLAAGADVEIGRADLSGRIRPRGGEFVGLSAPDDEVAPRRDGHIAELEL